MNNFVIQNYLDKFDTLEKKIFFSYNLGHSGFGDFLKYFAYTLHFCISYNIKLHLDFSHPISKYIKLKFPKLYLDYIPYNGYFVDGIDKIPNLLNDENNSSYNFYIITASLFYKDNDVLNLCNHIKFDDILLLLKNELGITG